MKLAFPFLFLIPLFFVGCGTPKKITTTAAAVTAPTSISPSAVSDTSGSGSSGSAPTANTYYILHRDNFTDMFMTGSSSPIVNGGGSYFWSGETFNLLSAPHSICLNGAANSIAIHQCSPYAYANIHYVSPKKCNDGVQQVDLGTIGYTCPVDSAGACPQGLKKLYFGTNGASNMVSYDKSVLVSGGWQSISVLGCSL